MNAMPCRFDIAAAICLALLGGIACASAQPANNPALAAASQAKDLTFPDKAEPASALTRPRMALLKPDGAGPFPAIVMFHQCSGLNTSMADWAKLAVSRGYVVLLIDSLGPRNAKMVCMGPQNGVNLARGTRDALQAAQYLRSQPFVDKERVALAGYSWGAMVGLLSSSRRYAGQLNAGPGFQAVASFYPGCFSATPQSGGRPFEIFNDDIGQPLLVLMGEADTETPPSDCLPKLEKAKAAGLPVAWHVYPKTTHCWDCKHADGHSKVDARGNKVNYRYDPAVTKDSTERLFGFLAEKLGQPRKTQ
jgi:dienelactone hydrolase